MLTQPGSTVWGLCSLSGEERAGAYRRKGTDMGGCFLYRRNVHESQTLVLIQRRRSFPPLRLCVTGCKLSAERWSCVLFTEYLEHTFILQPYQPVPLFLTAKPQICPLLSDRNAETELQEVGWCNGLSIRGNATLFKAHYQRGRTWRHSKNIDLFRLNQSSCGLKRNIC